MRRAVRLLIPFLFIFFSPYSTVASDVNLEKDLQRSLEQSSALIKQAIGKLASGNPIADEINKLKTVANDIRTLHLLLDQKFRIREEEIKTKGAKAQERHKSIEEGYRNALEEYLSIIDSLPPGGPISQGQLENLKVFLDNILHKKKKPLFGILPYTHLNYPAKEPNTDPAIKPAYKGGNKVVSPDDTKETDEAPISEEIAELAQSLNWNPVSIYEYVKNNIETEWYWGCMKGAEETLHQKSGNDCDQASLLVALLRASGFPSRYVRGTIEFFAGRDDPINKVKNLLGIDDIWKIAEFFQKAGIPYKPIMAGGNITNYQIEHIWVESQIPYANYRGAIIDEQGETWLGLDTSVKVKDYEYDNPIDILQAFFLSNIRDEYLSAMQTQTPLEYIRTRIAEHLNQSHPDKTYNDLLWTKTLPSEVMNIVPASMQFDQKKITHEYTEIPDELKHKVTFTASDMNNNELFTIILNTLNLSNQKIALSYEPETVEDQQIIDSYGGLDNTPAYLVRLRPMLKLNGDMLVAGKSGLPMGADFNLSIQLISPNGIEKITNTHIAGNLSAIGIVAQKTGSGQLLTIAVEDNAEEILFKETQNYINRWNQAEEELASLMHLNFARPIPTVVTIGGVIDVTYVLDTPHGYEWKGVYCNANSRTVEVTPSHSPLTQEGDGNRQKIFMQLSALQGSILENRIFEDDFQVESISTAKLFEIANSNQTPLLTIDKTNVSTVLPTLPFDDNIKGDITNAVNQNLTATIPNQEITYKDWTGIGYVKENPETKESGYLLSGMIAGGMTAVSPNKWSSQYLADMLGEPYGGDYSSIVITSPKNGTTVTTSQITVSGIVLDSKAKVSVNGIEAMVDGSTFTASGINLNRGINVITAIAINEADKKTSSAITIKYEIPVMIYITFPYDSADLSVTPIDVEGIVSDPSASVSVNNIKATVSGDGRFIASGVSLSEGINQITAQATNIDGKTGSHIINVNYKTGQVNPISISITSPEANATINRPSIMVRGTVTADSEEVSIKVNGILAEKYGNQFVANGVPLVEGTNRIIVNALGSNGAIGRAEITVNAVTPMPYITLSANIISGIPPLTPYFLVSTEIPNPIVNYEMDFEGDGVIDYTGTTFEDISYAYTTEGIYYPTLTVTDDQGNRYTDTIAVTVMNKAQIDNLLKSKWEGMKSAIVNQNISGAVMYFAEDSRQLYSDIFSSLKNELPQLAREMQEIQLIYAKDNTAKYRIRKTELYGGQMLTITHYIYFVIDRDGIWKIIRF